MAATKLIRRDVATVRRILKRAGIKAVVTASQSKFDKLTRGYTDHSISIPPGNASPNRMATRNERIAHRFHLRVFSYLPKHVRKQLQPVLPLNAAATLKHGFVFLVGEVWAERLEDRGRRRWLRHREDGPAMTVGGEKRYFYRGWQVKRETLMSKPTVEVVLAETNVTDREVLIRRMGLERFITEAKLTTADEWAERGAKLLKRVAHHDQDWSDDNLAYVAVTCPSTQKQYFLRVPPTTATAKEALAWTAHNTMPYDQLAVET